MRCLLDTHAFLWWIADDSRLSGTARHVVEDPANEILFSVASAWEIAIKASLGKMVLPGHPSEFIPQQIAGNGLSVLTVQLRHALSVHDLPPLHRDPFDRLLVAQAINENVPIISADPSVTQYAVTSIW